jgi:hypothetical protein
MRRSKKRVEMENLTKRQKQGLKERKKKKGERKWQI